jgi:hypothetical protein
MEEHSTTQQQPVAIGGGKRELTKKQKIATGLAAFIALVGIGIGGYFGWQNIISNAEGETDLGTDVVMATSPTPYIKVSQESHQSVCIKLPESEATTRENNYAEGDTVGMGATWLYSLKSDYVVQRASGANPTKWITIADGGSVNPAQHLQVTSLEEKCDVVDFGYSNIGMPYPPRGDGRFDPDQMLQYGTLYSYRVAQKQGDTVVPKGNIQTIAVEQLPSAKLLEQKANYITLSFGIDRSTTVGWEQRDGLTIVRSRDSTVLKNGGKFSAVERVAQYKNGSVVDPVGTTFTTQQPLNSVYYYATVVSASGDEFYAGNPIAVSTNDKKIDDAISLTIDKTSIPADLASSLSGTLSLNPSYAYSKQPYITTYAIWLDIDSNSGTYRDCWLSGYDVVTPTDPASAFNVQPLGQVTPALNNINASNQVIYNAKRVPYCDPYLEKGGKIKVTAQAELSTSLGRSADQDIQTVMREVTIDKISPQMTAKYGKNKIARGNTVDVYTNRPAISGISVPKGKVLLKNRRTGKILATNTCTYGCGAGYTFSWKAKKRGTYKLDVVYQADATQALYTDQTVKLPDLVVR